ncbi:MAG TPA: hypothetical protein VFV91_06525 [Gaiellaceae bacterium]|nr:hypothetical protein [Gaiellaceae bacterium]
MTNKISFPPLLDLPPGQLQARKEQLFREMTREPEKPLYRLPIFTSPGFRIAALAGAAAGLAAAGIGLTIAFSGGAPIGTHRPGGNAPLGITLSPDAPSIGSSVDVTVASWTPDASLRLQVLRDANAPGTEPSVDSAQVVFVEEVPMTNATIDSAPGGGGKPGATWSGTLSTSDWSGACQANAVYSITATVLNNSTGARTALDESRWFSCTPH